MKYIRRLVLAFLAVIVLAAAAIFIAGPHTEIAQAFERYRAAFDAGDAALVARLTAPPEIELADAQRRVALWARKVDVERLSFRFRAGVLALRKKVIDGKIPLQVLQDNSDAAFFAASLPVQEMAAALRPMVLLFALPTGTSSANGYLGVTNGGEIGWQHYVLALAGNVHYRFVKSADGEWLVDPTPLLKYAASQNEGFALQVDPTGNRYIIKNLLQETDEVRVQRLWKPLLRQ